MPQLLKTSLAGLALLYIAVCAALFFFQRSLIYYPRPRSHTDGVTTLVLPSASERIIVSSLPRDGAKALVYFGGNAEDVSLNMPDFSEEFPLRAIYLLHYRGYGGSSGQPSEQGLFADSLALFDYVHAMHPNVMVMGRSLGSGVAVYLASRRPVEKLILVTPYNSLTDVAANQYPYIPVRWILRDRFESWRYAPQVKMPTLILAGAEDTLIPPSNTALLQSHFEPGLAVFHLIPRAGHNNIEASDEYQQLLRSFGG